jgi:hypothetical protein
MHRKQVDALQRVVFGGIYLLERERRYPEAVHYLHLVLSAWQTTRQEDLEDPNPSTRWVYCVGSFWLMCFSVYNNVFSLI